MESEYKFIEKDQGPCLVEDEVIVLDLGYI